VAPELRLRLKDLLVDPAEEQRPLPERLVQSILEAATKTCNLGAPDASKRAVGRGAHTPKGRQR